MFSIQTEQLYRHIVETSTEGIWIVDDEMRTQFVNRRMAEMLGYAADEMAGTSLLDYIFDEDKEKVYKEREHRRSGLSERYETRLKRKNGSTLWARISTNPLYDESGKFIGALGMFTDITENKESEDRLEKAEERYRAFIGQSSEGIWRFEFENPVPVNLPADEQVRQFYEYAYLAECNDALAIQYGLSSADELIGKRLTEFHVPDDPQNYEYLRAFVESGYRLTDTESHEKDADGNDRYFLNNLVGFIEDGKLARVWGTQRDITERKKAEEISARYRLLSIYARDVILFLRSDGKIIEANQKAIETYGYDHQTFLQLSIKDLRAPETFTMLAEQLERANEGGVQFETTHRRKDGSEFPVEVSATGVDIGGERMLISIVRDVNERKQAQEALIKAERKAAEEYQALLQRIVPLGQTLGTARDLISIYRAVLEFVRTSMSCSGFFISFYDSENRRRIAAYAWGEGAEVDISELPPMPLTKDGGPNSQAVFQKKTVIINHYWDEQKKRPHVILREDGVNPMSSLVVPMLVKNEVIGTLEVQAHENEAFREEQAIALGMAANLAAVAIENVRLLEVEANARRVAEDANRAKDEFLSVLSHELRTPLNAMLGWVKMLRAGMLDDNRTSQALEVIERNTRLQNNLIEDLLDVSRIISGKMRIEKELVDLKTVVQNSIEILRPAAANKNLELEFTAQDDSPLIYGDETRLNQIVNNLVQNAVKFTPEGGKISVGLKQNGSSTFLSVKDTGVGIERKILPFIFDRFRQADASTKRSFSGLGLGLTIVRNLVELHGGRIKVESGGRGTGATFTVEFLLAENFHLDESDADGKHTQLSDNFALKGMRILLVDDDRESLIPLQIFLEREKAEVVPVVSAKDALKKLSEQDFHILISDIGMPETDGYDLISQVREFTTERNAFLPAIALTAYASNEDRRRALSAGFQMHFSKPIDFDELAEALKDVYKDLK